MPAFRKGGERADTEILWECTAQHLGVCLVNVLPPTWQSGQDGRGHLQL